jgi:hypothetical protein
MKQFLIMSFAGQYILCNARFGMSKYRHLNIIQFHECCEDVNVR